MKVLAICASPREGGNSDILCDRFLQGARQKGHETEKISLARLSISPCQACYACAKTKQCAIADDMEMVRAKLIAADVIVLASPVYFYCMAGQLKVMIDRCLPFYTQLADKKFWLVVTAADSDKEAASATLAGMRGFLSCLPGATEQGVLYGTGAWEKGEIMKLPVLEEAFQAGASL